MEKLIEILIEQYEYDVIVMSQPWMYWWLLIPITCYVVFFFLKWSVLTGPLWVPLSLLISVIKEK